MTGLIPYGYGLGGTSVNNMSKLYESAEKAKKKFERLDIATRLTRNPNYSISFLFIQKTRIIAVYLLFTLISIRSLRKSKQITRSQKNIGKGMDALVIAGGPSALRINLKEIKEDQIKKKVAVFAMNWYTHTELASQLTPDYYVLSDPITQINRNGTYKGRQNVEIWSQVAKWTQTKLILPHNWFSYAKHVENKISMYIDNRELIGFSKSTDPTRPRGYSSLTALNAIAAALYMGFDNVYLIGLDGDMFKALRVDLENSLYFGNTNLADNAGSPLTPLSHLQPGGMADMLYNFSTEFLDIKRCFTDERIFNLNKNSLVDGFKKLDEHRFLNQQQLSVDDIK